MDCSEKTYRTEPKPPLITPSASPPHYSSRPLQPSPTKRPRLSSAPRQVQQRASSSSSTPADSFNFHHAREESAMRLLDAWAGLAERYSRPLDEDDIIDITIGKVVKDRGVLRGSQTFTVGAFVDPNLEDAEDDLEEDEEEDDNDEFDSLANPAMRGIDVLPLVDLDARDAQDLKEFMEAEQRRREIYGSEADETEGSIYESQLDETLGNGSDRNASEESRLPEPIHVDSGSEDELGGWDLKEASAVYRLRKEEDSDSEAEVLNKSVWISPEVPSPPWTSPKTPSRRVSNQRQLQSPLPDDFSDHPPPTSPPRSSSPLSQYDSSPIKSRPGARGSKKPVSDRKRTIASQAQPKHLSSPIPRLDLTKVSELSVKSKQIPSRAHISGSTKTKKPSKKMSVHSSNRLKGKSKQPTSNVNRQSAPSQVSPQREHDAPQDKIERKSRLTPKAKGKQKAPFADKKAESSEEASPRQPSPHPASKLGSSGSRSLRPSASALRTAEPLLDDVGSSIKKPKPKPLATLPSPIPGKKRKRIVSSAETVDETRTSSPEPPTQDISRNPSTSQFRRQSNSVSDEPDIIQDFDPTRKEKRKHNPQQGSSLVESESDDASQEEEINQGQRYSSRAPSHFNVPHYPYPPPLYLPHHLPNLQQPIYTPLQDSHAQYILTQAMQQIFALGSGAWAPLPPQARGSTPLTPKHHRRHRGDYSPPPSMYSTPMHHPHPYPYYYDPLLSTLPPSSPEVPSSPPGMSASGGQPRRKSLVKRGQSTGRRISFIDEKSDTDVLSGTDAYRNQADSPTRRQVSRSGSIDHRKKGKGKARDYNLLTD
ncbi:hypothetical protein E4T56_gene13234 [Termitomyces sp. T112]|nr:hypothetical protein E4T56_gene13234 [Termitomyces sp. T112]